MKNFDNSIAEYNQYPAVLKHEGVYPLKDVQSFNDVKQTVVNNENIWTKNLSFIPVINRQSYYQLESMLCLASYYERYQYFTISCMPDIEDHILVLHGQTLSDYDGNPRHGVLGIVLPEMYNKIYKGSGTCSHCGQQYSYVCLNDDTVIREFWQNYYLQPVSDGCDHYNEDGRYCVLCRLEEFKNNPEFFIDKAYDKTQSNIAKEVHYKDIEHDYKLRDE